MALKNLLRQNSYTNIQAIIIAPQEKNIHCVMTVFDSDKKQNLVSELRYNLTGEDFLKIGNKQIKENIVKEVYNCLKAKEEFSNTEDC